MDAFPISRHRMVKEVAGYEKEAQDNEAKVQKMRDEGKDAYDVRKQEEVRLKLCLIFKNAKKINMRCLSDYVNGTRTVMYDTEYVDFVVFVPPTSQNFILVYIFLLCTTGIQYFWGSCGWTMSASLTLSVSRRVPWTHSGDLCGDSWKLLHAALSLLLLQPVALLYTYNRGKTSHLVSNPMRFFYTARRLPGSA